MTEQKQPDRPEAKPDSTAHSPAHAAEAKPEVPSTPDKAPDRQSREFRDTLLRRLPELNRSGWSDVVKVSFQEDLEAAAAKSVNADVFLTLLEKIKPSPRDTKDSSEL